MIYTVTLNPAIDYIIKSDDIKMGELNRSSSEQICFGGKGINVSIVLKELGVESKALGFIAGFTGQALKSYLDEKGVKNDFVVLEQGMTRINVKLKTSVETEINARGPLITKEDIEKFYKKLDNIGEGDTLVLSGSTPSTLPKNIYESILSSVDGRGVNVVIDAEKELLISSLKYKPLLIKPNLKELSDIAERELQGENDITEAARALREKGARNVLVSMGADGALLLAENGKNYRAKAHRVNAKNTVGAGDSMVAGFMFGIGKGYEQALMYGIAAGSATAASIGLAEKNDIYNIIQKMAD